MGLTVFGWSWEAAQEQWLGVALALLLLSIMWVMLTYGVRQTVYCLNRLYATHRYPYQGIRRASWPMVTVFVAAHNEEAVIADCIEALLQTDYPQQRLKVVIVNDRSSDSTRLIVDRYAACYPGRIEPFHRSSGKPGKAAALKDAMSLAKGDIALIFDADYTPGKTLLRELVAPFFNPEVGAVMGRVVPRNAGSNLLTRILDLERSAGYQVDQQARMSLRTVPQYGGTVGGIRLSAANFVGGWNDDVLAEDTDITFRLLIAGWKTVYINHAACLEEVPEEWSVRMRQIHRWATGHNQVLLRYWHPLLVSRHVATRERVDGLMLLGIFLMQPLLLMGWAVAIAIYYLNASQTLTLLVPVALFVVYGTIASFSAFMQIGFAVLVDGHRRRIRLLPLQLLSFITNLSVISSAFIASLHSLVSKRELVWKKTVRYRKQVSS